MIIALSLSLLATPTADAAPRFAIDGAPIFGSFAVRWLADELEQALDSGINLVFCYERRPSAELLNPKTEMGALLAERGAKAMANVCFLPAGIWLREAVDENATTILLGRRNLEAPLPCPGMFWVEDEAVEYESYDKGVLSSCTRGAQGTEPAAHPKGLFVLHDGMARQAILAVKDWPNLWGYWALDDKKGNQQAALRNLYRLIKEVDVNADGKPNDHVVVAGMANFDALANFDRDTCDMVGIYIYPARREQYEHDLIRSRLREMLPVIRERSPDMPFMGIYQAFTGPKWEPKPTPLQLRKEMTDWLRYGASGLMAYSWRMVEPYETVRNLPDLKAEIVKFGRALRSGEFQVDQPVPAFRERPQAKLDLATTTPLVDFASLTTDALRLGKGISVETGDAPLTDGRRAVLLHFDEYEVGGNEWPGAKFDRGAAFQRTDWSGYGFLAMTVQNPTDVDSEIGLSIRDSRGKPWWAQYFPLPAKRETVVAAPLSEVGKIIDLTDVASFTTLMRRPPVATDLAVCGFGLLPLQIVDTRQPAISLPAKIDLLDDWGEASSLKPTSITIEVRDGALHLTFACAVPDVAQLRAEVTEHDASPRFDDHLELYLQPVAGEKCAHVEVNPKGTVRDELLTPTGSDLPWSFGGEVSSQVRDGKWTVDLTLPLASLGRSAGANWLLQAIRHDTELGRFVLAMEDRAPSGAISARRVVLQSDHAR